MGREQGIVTTRKPRPQPQLSPSASRIFAVNQQMNQLVLEHLDPAAWKAKPPGDVRTIAAIFTHMHNVRCKWIRLTAPHLKVPAQLNRANCTPQQATHRLGRKRSSLHRNARSGTRQRRTPHRIISQRCLGQTLAGWNGNALLHDVARSPPSRTSVHARPSTRVSPAKQSDIRNVELGEALEGKSVAQPSAVANSE